MRASDPALDAQLHDAQRDRVSRLDLTHARERHRRARAATPAWDASDERPVARRLANPAGVGALEEQRARGGDPGVDRAADVPRELDSDGCLAGPGVDSPDDALRAHELPRRRHRGAGRGRDHDPGAGHRDADLKPLALVGGLTCRDAHGQRGRQRDHGGSGADHGTLLNHMAESAPATSRKSTPAPANATVISSFLRVLPRRDFRSA